MARAKNNGAAPAAEVSISSSFGETLFDRLQVSKLRLLLEQLYPDKKVEQRGATTLLMNCVNPGHDDRRPSFYIYTNINRAVCKSCGYRTRNLLEMFQTSLGISYAESIIRIHEITGQRVANDKVTKQLDKLDVHYQATKIFGDICNTHLINLITYALHKAPIEAADVPLYTDALFHTVRPVLDWLFQQRRLSPDKTAYSPYGVMPTDKIFQELARRAIDQIWTLKLQAGVLTSAYSTDRRAALLDKLVEMHKTVPAEQLHAVTFHTGYSTTLAGRIRCRRVTRDTGTDNNFWMLPGFTDNDPVGYLGLLLPQNSGLRRMDSERTRVIVVESEMSMLAGHEKLIDSGIPDVIVLASAGSNNDSDMIFRAGFETADLMMDHPDPAYGKGEDQIKIKLSTALHLQARVFVRWDDLRDNVLTVKDPDDVLQHHGWPHFRKFVFEEADRSFIPADAWASERAIEEGLTVPENNILGRQSKAVEFGYCVRHPALLSAFVTRVSAALGVPAGPLRSAIVKIKDDEAGFIARIVETFKTDFVVLFKDETLRPGMLYLFHKETRRHLTLCVTDGPGMVAALSNIYGEMYTYFNDHIGLPGRREGEEHVPGAVAIRDGQKLIADYLKIAFQSIFQGVLTQDECIPLGAGTHFETHPDDPDLAIVRIHNGDRWYKLIVDSRTDRLTAKELPGPIDGRYIFMPGVPSYSKNIQGVDDLLEGNDVTIDTLRAHFFRLCEFLDAGWKFRTQRQDVMFLAAIIFVFAAGDAFDIKLILRIIGESNSGKSTAQGFLGKGQYPNLQIVEHSAYLTGYTLASIYLMFNRSSLSAVLEEASQDANVATHKTKALEDIQEMLRQVIYAGGAVIKRFGPHGKLLEYFLRMNVSMTQVQEPRDVQDANRSYIVETVRSDSQRDPVITLAKMCAPGEIEKIRRDLSIGLLRLMPRLRRSQNEIYKTLNEKQLASFQAPTRFLRNFAPIGAVLQTLGLDWEPMVVEMIESRKNRLLSQAANSTSGLVYDKLLRAPIVPVPNSRNAFLSVMQCATMAGGYEMLNGAGIGITLNPNNWTLIVDFVAATSPGGAVYRMNDLNKHTPHQLKALLDHHPDVVRPHRYKELGVMEALAANNITALEYEISVLSIGRLREQVMGRAASYTGLALTSAKTDTSRAEAVDNL